MKMVISLKELKKAVTGLSRVETSRSALLIAGVVRVSGIPDLSADLKALQYLTYGR